MSNTLLKLENVTKQYPGTLALDDVSFEVKKGEVLVLLGENGAGKSTLMKIISGVQTPDKGKIYVEGQRVQINDPLDSIKLGIGMVYQELSLVPGMSACENIYLGQYIMMKNSPLINWAEVRKKTIEVSKIVGLDIDINRPVSEFGLGIQQLVEISRAISRNAKLVILDEPTSALTDIEIDILFDNIRSLKKQGISFIFITHKLNEVFRIGDRVSVLRDGRNIGTLDSLEAVTEDQLILMMVGRTIQDQYPKVSYYNKDNANENEEILSVKGLSDGKHFKDVSFNLHRGEVFGIAGLVGSGREELAEALAGLRKIKGGTVLLRGKGYAPKNPWSAIRNRFGYLPSDRRKGLLLNMPIYVNITILNDSEFSNLGFRKKKKEMEAATKFTKQLNVSLKSVTQKVSSLSGGNAQKIQIGKLLCGKSDIFVMDDPTRGIDVGAKVEVYNIINEIVKGGAGVILISSEMPELMAMSDTVAVMNSGKMMAIFDLNECTAESIMKIEARE